MAHTLELLAPAKNLEQGREAINHGADALYIGPPAYGARVAANNSLDDIEQLVRYAHLFHSKVYVTVNTLLYDDEIEQAARLIHQLYNIGVDAVLIQDMGLLQCDLPPIELHASTQTHNATAKRVKFLEQVGFSRIVLARETSLQQMKEIRSQTKVELETFIQGALCVSYSGQCYLSEYLTHRSGNRGCCTQPCRSAYDLYNAEGQRLIKDKHLLSLKDFSAAQHIEDMADAGIISFKIEGRLKDMSYIKNTTAFYRRLIDNILERRTDYLPASSGQCSFFFTPDIERTFNRGFTDYFLQKRQPIASMTTQKSIGKAVGRVRSTTKDSIVVDSHETFVAGDGLCYFDDDGLHGFQINQVSGKVLIPNKMINIKSNTPLYRNHDFAFEKMLQGKTSERKIKTRLVFEETPDGFALQITDEDGCGGTAAIANEKVTAQQPERAQEQIERQLTKLGNTIFKADEYIDMTKGRYFLSASRLNELRRNAIERLEQERLKQAQPTHSQHQDNGNGYVEERLNYQYNVVNHLAEQFYKNHGAKEIESGIEISQQFEGKALMTTKYCLRYELGQCLMHKNNRTVSPEYQSELYLHNNRNVFQLRFDCKNCQMLLYKK